MTPWSHLYRSFSFATIKPLPRAVFLSSSAISYSSLAQRPPEMSSAAQTFVEETIAKHKIVVFSKSWCPYCRATKNYFGNEYPEETVNVVELDKRDDGDDIQNYLKAKTGARSVPRTFISGESIGGNDDLQAKPESEIKALMAKRS